MDESSVLPRTPARTCKLRNVSFDRVTRCVVGVSIYLQAGCTTNEPPDPSTAKPLESVKTLLFRQQDLPFQYERGETGSAWPVETTGGGVGLLDFDGDGRLDLFFAQGGPLKPAKDERPTSDVLLRNLGDGRFEDISERVQLAPKGYGQGVTVADYDADGDPDVYVTRYGRNTLWRNDREQGRFTDVTEEAGVGCGSWSLGAAFGDFDQRWRPRSVRRQLFRVRPGQSAVSSATR